MTVDATPGGPDADSYVTRDVAALYALERGLKWSERYDVPEAALRRATAWIDATYKFPGVRTNGRGQALQWPRIGAADRESNTIPSGEIPVEVIHATVEAASAEIANPGFLTPAGTAAGTVKSEKVGSIAVEYVGGGYAATLPRVAAVDNLLAGIAIGVGSNTKFLDRA